MKQNEKVAQKYEVSPLELSFDLIYAFALSQVTEFIIQDLSWLTVVKALIIMGAIYMVWSYTSWAVTMVPTEQAKSRTMLIVIMILGFFMNVSIDESFGAYGYIFAGLYLLIQLGRTIWTLINSPSDPFTEHFIRVLIWMMISAPLWAAGIFFHNNIRVGLWGVAIFIDLLGTWTAHPIPTKIFHSEDLSFDDGHILERCRLFRIIALGEMVFTAGDAIKEVHLSLMTVILGCVAMIEIISLYMLSFGRFVKIVAKHRENNNNPVLVSRYAINVLVVILVGIVFISVGNKYIILHPYERAPLLLVCLLGSGPLMFLVAQGWYLHKIPKYRPVLYIISAIILLVSNIIGLYQPAWLYQMVMGGVLVVIAYMDYRRIEKLEGNH